MLCLLFGWVGSALADEFVVLHVDPPDADITAGAIYEPNEFIFVPDTTTVVLMDRSGARYLVEGMAAVAIDPVKLERFRLAGVDDGFSPVFNRILKRPDLPFIAAGRNLANEVSKPDTLRRHPALRLHADLLEEHARGIGFCLVGGELILRRSDPAVRNFAELTVNGNVSTHLWGDGAAELRVPAPRLSEEANFTMDVTTRDHSGKVKVRILGEDVLGQSRADIAKALASQGCTLQALMIAG